MSGRRLRELSVVLSLVLMVMLGAIIVVWVSGGGLLTGGVPTPSSPSGATPTTIAGSPSPTEPASPLPSPSGTANGTLGPQTPSSSPLESPSPSPSASPVAGPPQREIAFLDIGLDAALVGDEEPSVPRMFTFVAEGPGRIEARISNVSFGRVRACIWQGTPDQQPAAECQTVRRSDTLARDIQSGPQQWTVSLIGSQAGASPSADLRLRWPTNDARMRIEGFRFQGEEIENYNGFTAELQAQLDGQLSINATFDDGFGGAYPWLLTAEQVGGGPSQTFVDEGNASSMQSGAAVGAGQRYRVTLSNRETVSEQRVLVSADLDWP